MQISIADCIQTRNAKDNIEQVLRPVKNESAGIDQIKGMAYASNIKISK